MYCRNYAGTVNRVLCREVCYTVSLFGRALYQRFHCIPEHRPHARSNMRKCSRTIYHASMTCVANQPWFWSYSVIKIFACFYQIICSCFSLYSQRQRIHV